jgi:hypothetical protein
MKDDKLKGKSQTEQAAGQRGSDSKRPKTDEDLDFEILDALEQIEQTGKIEESGPESEDTFDLNLDEGDLTFEAEAAPEGGFQFNERADTGLEEELTETPAEFTLEDSFGAEMGAGIKDEGDFDLSLEGGLDLESEEMEIPAETDEMSFDLDESTNEVEFGSLKTEVIAEEELSPELETEPAEVDLTLEGSEFNFDIGLEAGGAEISSGIDFGELDLDAGEPKESFQNEEADLMGQEETPEESIGSAELSTVISDESLSDEVLSDMDFESESEEFSGKAVISVDGDQVIDLGDETELGQEEEFGANEDFAESAVHEKPEEFDETFDMAAEETSEDLEAISKLADKAVADLTAEQEQEADFMASLEDINIDLGGEESAEVLDTSSAAEMSELTEETTEEDLSAMRVEETSEFGFGNMAIPEDEEEEIKEPFFEEDEEDYGAEIVPPEIDTTAASPEPVEDEREALGLTLRLTDAEVNQFEKWVAQAKTFQSYVTELEKHQAEIKATIYQKLLNEYAARKTDIFKQPEFLRMQGDIEQDLQDLLTRGTEFVSKIDRLNEELEEVKVRHLVGEYNDETLSERQAAQKTEIMQWQDKTEKINKFIARYQELLELECALNPLRQEPASVQAEEAIAEQAEETIAAPETAAVAEETALVVEEMPDEWETPGQEFEMPSEELSAQAFSEETLVTEDAMKGDEFSEMTEAKIEEEEPVEEMINCKKCGKSTPAAEKFCVNCGAKAR